MLDAYATRTKLHQRPVEQFYSLASQNHLQCGGHSHCVKYASKTVDVFSSTAVEVNRGRYTWTDFTSQVWRCFL